MEQQNRKQQVMDYARVNPSYGRSTTEPVISETPTCCAPGMMVEIKVLSFKGRLAKVINQVNGNTWSLQVAGRLPMNFIDHEFKPSVLHKPLNQRMLLKHSNLTSHMSKPNQQTKPANQTSKPK